jgi:type II secretory pathway predicted ATPase ExeA
MSTVGASEMARLRALKTPPYDEVVDAANRWMVQRGISAADFGREIDNSRSTMNIFLQGRWLTHNGIHSPELLTAKVWEHISENPAREPRRPSGRLLDTEGAKLIRRRFDSARRGSFVLLCGPSGAEKSFVLQHLVAEREVAGHDDAIYIYCGSRTGPLTMLRMIARELGLGIRSNICLSLREGILAELARRKKRVAIIADEAQHATFDGLESLREIHDLSGDNLQGVPGCGIVMAGSHDLYEYLSGPARRSQLEQNNSRIDFSEQLTGMTRDEVLKIAAHELGNGRPAKLNEEQQARILNRCVATDRYARNEVGEKFPRNYFSCRKLVKYLDQVRGEMPTRHREVA